MKNLIILLLVITSFNVFAQGTFSFSPVEDTLTASDYQEAVDHVFANLPKAHYPSGYLFNKTAFPTKYLFCNGTLNDSSFNNMEWYFIQNIIRNSYYHPDSLISYPKIDSLKNDYINKHNILPIGVVNIIGHSLKDTALRNGSLLINDGQFIENTSNLSKIYGRYRLFSVCPLSVEINTLSLKFELRSEFSISNSKNNLSKIEMSFDDGEGFKTLEYNTPIEINYLESGFKQMITRFIYTNGDTLYSRSELLVNPIYDFGSKGSSSGDPAPDAIWKFTNAIDGASLGDYPPEFSEPFYHNAESDGGIVPNLLNTGEKWDHRGIEVGVFFGCGNNSGALRKPILLFGGYNPKNGKSITGNGISGVVNNLGGPLLAIAGWRGSTYDSYNGTFTEFSKINNNSSLPFGIGLNLSDNGNNLIDKLKAEGFDVLIIRFRDGIGFLQNNAFLQTLLIKKINQNILSETDNVTNPGADFDPEGPNYPFNPTKIKRAKHELVVGGLSAGSLSLRMSLLLMEYENWKRKCDPRNKPHRVKTWIAFEHESQGSNTPIGQQMFMDFEKSLWFMPANSGDIVISLLSEAAIDMFGIRGVASQNTLYHYKKLIDIGSANWTCTHHSDFDNYFKDLTSITPTFYPENLKGYPNNCYRIAVCQGNANGISQHNNTTTKMIDHISPTSWCVNLVDLTWWSMQALINQSTTYLIEKIADAALPPGVSLLPFRQANARVMNTWNNNAFKCKIGFTVKTYVYSWHVNIGHWKYHDNNYVNDLLTGTHIPYDAAPGSTLPSHLLLCKKLPPLTAYRSLTGAALGDCNFVDYNDFQDGFASTPSLLDLHSPGNNTLPRLPNFTFIPGNVSGGMNLMQQNNYSGVINNASPNGEFGYPHLIHPNNPYDYTPYDAIWANTTNDNKYDDNSMHVEDPNPLIGQFLLEEIAPQNLYLSNRIIKGDNYICGGNVINDKYYADFEARKNVLAGNQSIYKRLSDPNDINSEIKYPRIRTGHGDFVVDDGAVVTLRTNNENGTSSVTLGAGFIAKAGCIFRAYVYNDTKMCVPYSASRLANNNFVQQENNFERPIISTQMLNKIALNETGVKIEEVNVFPNPSNGILYFETEIFTNFTYKLMDVEGRILEQGELPPKLNLNSLKKGVYLILIKSKNIEQTNKIILY